MQIQVIYNIPENLLADFKENVLDRYADYYRFDDQELTSINRIINTTLEDGIINIIKSKEQTTREIFDKIRKVELFKDINYKRIQRSLISLVLKKKLSVRKTLGGAKGTFNIYSIDKN